MVFKFEHLAKNGAEMPDGLNGAEKTLYLQLRMLYHQLKEGVISRETAAKDKRKLERQFELDSAICDNLRRRNEQFLLTDEARCRYRKNRTLENADLFLNIFDGLVRRI